MRRSIPLVLALLAARSAPAGDWPQFRGPGATGVSDEKDLPDTWSADSNVVWKVDVPGRGWSSPIVWKDRIYLTSAESETADPLPKKGLYLGGEQGAPSSPRRWMVYCLDREKGKVLWEKAAHEGVPTSSSHVKNTHASETPVTDGERVHAYFGNVGLFTYDMDGKPLWSKKWGTFKTRYGWGMAASPALHGGRIFIVNDNEEQSFLVALDAKTGDQLWRVDRDEKSNWATPFVWKNDRRVEIVTAGSGKVRAYDLEGKLLWHLSGMSGITIPTPFAKEDLLYVGSGFVGDARQPIYAIRAGASGDITVREDGPRSEFVSWHEPRAAPYNPSMIAYGDHLYVLFDRGFLSCHDARTGKALYEKRRLSGESAAFTSSPWAHGGKVFCLSEDGDTFVVQAGPELKVLRKNPLGEMCMATPALSGGSTYIRTLTKLYRIEGRKKKDGR